MSANIGYGILVGAGVLFTIVVSTYVLAYLADRLCSSPDVERISSPVSNMAGLWGLKPEERTKILEKVFQMKKTIRNYRGRKTGLVTKEAPQSTTPQHPSPSSLEIEMTELKPTASEKSSTTSIDTEIEASDDHSTNETPKEPTNDNNTDLEMGGGEANSNVAEIVATATKEEQIAMGILQTQELSPESLENMCAICLVEYGRLLVYFNFSCVLLASSFLSC